MAPAGHGENARLEQARTHPLQQRGIAVFAHNLLVHAPRLFRIEQLGRVLLAVHHQGHFLNGPVVRKGEDKRYLQNAAARVLERLTHLHLGYLIRQAGIHLQLGNLVLRRRRYRSWPRDRPWMRRVGRIDNDRARKPYLLVRIHHDQQPLGRRENREQQGDQHSGDKATAEHD